MSRMAAKLSQVLVGFAKQRAGGNSEHFRNIEQPLVQQPSSAMLDMYEHISCNSGFQRECLLRQALLDP